MSYPWRRDYLKGICKRAQIRGGRPFIEFCSADGIEHDRSGFQKSGRDFAFPNRGSKKPIGILHFPTEVPKARSRIIGAPLSHGQRYLEMLLKNVLEECGHSDPVLVNVVNVLSLVGLQSAERMPQVMEPYMTAVSGWPCRIRLRVLLDAEENQKALQGSNECGTCQSQ